jgi:ELWxxDGT repeat protein
MISRYALLLAILPATLLLFAQETAVKISDFDYGLTGRSKILNVQSVDGELYGAFWGVFGDDGASLISKLDPETGAAMPILDPDVTGWFGGLPTASIPSVISVDGMTFGIQQDNASGGNLYRIDGDEATLLLSNPNFSYSELVAFNDSIYFVVAGLPVSQSPTSLDSQVAELWRTDGTPEGTQMVTSLPFFHNPFFTHLEAGESNLLISVANDHEEEFSLYDATTSRLRLLSQGINQFTLNLNTFSWHFSPTGFYDGGFYVFGQQEGNQDHQIFRIDEGTYDITPIDLPEVFDPLSLFEIYDEIDFVNFQDSLYVFAGRSDSGNGVDLYQIQGEDGTELEALLVNDQTTGSVLGEDEYPSIVVEADTLFFLSRRPETDLVLYAYSNGMQAPAVRATISGPAIMADEYDSYWLNIDEDNFYATSRNGDGLMFRINRSTGVRDSALISIRQSIIGFNNPLTALKGSLYFINRDFRSQPYGLYRWSSENNAPAPLGNYVINNNGNSIIVHGYSENTDLLYFKVDSVLTYTPATETFAPLNNPRRPGSGIFTFIGAYQGGFYYLNDNNNNWNDGYQIAKSENGVLSPVPICSDELAINETNYRLSSRFSLNDSTMVCRFQPNGFEPGRTHSLIRFSAAGLTVSPLVPQTAQREGHPSYFANGGFSFYYTDANGIDLTVVFDSDGNQVMLMPTDLSLAPRGLSESGVFMESVDPVTFENSILFFPFSDISNPEILAFDQAVPTTNDRLFYSTSPYYVDSPYYIESYHYVVGGNLVFTATSLTAGTEWHVAIPGTGEVALLADVNPGTGLGAPTSIATPIGDLLFFNANDGTNGNEPWVTDGTPENTRMVADIFPGPSSSNPSHYYEAERTIFFAANGPQGYEVYRMGTDNLNPELIINLNDEDGDSHPYGFILAGEDIYFIGREAAGETYELYRIAFDLVPTDAEPTRVAARVFPNPIREQPLNVQAPEGEEFHHLQLFNQQGQLLQKATANGNTSSFDLGELPAGNYWLRSWYKSGRFCINAVQLVN